LREAGFEAIDNWFAGSERADEAWQEYSKLRGRTYREALQSREAGHIYYFDLAYIHLAHAAVLVWPAGRSGHLEFGYTVGQGKLGYILTPDEPTRYDVMAQFSPSLVWTNEHDMIKQMREDMGVNDHGPGRRSVDHAPWNA
jgi:hypothetical protein